ncbi:riboflavin biosynthesis protein RibD [Nocardioides sp. Root1257]|uniref:dihydrofolate reductase family protein n=1 Tax=unclassified Nocardioides TaxID=2615069 RepID=UPI0006F94AEF|nr:MULTISPECIES: dihydrofolate reductase family protein [unclassified Nocardioides]KQW49438.1 riboflavin biosynthesis protein RibD [Nocardioides sp. Root1257]KRC48611.1 riboflavin biosynthesis protein RibD [Nocardioides sp. Root224]
MRVLVGPDTDDLGELYAPLRTPWLRVNMVSTVDGAATGESGTSGSINNAADKEVFDHLRATCDVIVVGAATARAEGYGPAERPIVVVSRRDQVPEGLRDAPAGSVVVRPLGDSVDFRAWLLEQGWSTVLCEGGPTLLGHLLTAGVVDELCTTFVPRAVGGDHGRISVGPPVDVPLTLHTLLEQDGTLLARWLV